MKTIFDIMDHNKAIRLRLMLELYEQTKGSTRTWVDLRVIAQHLKIDTDDFKNAYHYLLDEGFITPYGAGYTSYMTHQGLKEVERSLSNPDRSTEYFVAYSELDIPNGTKEKL